jgi:DNA-binding response OmpR family regulator
LRVLVVEDSESLRRSLAKGLREAGYAVDAVGDGKSALIYGQTTDYDAIILDLMLPGMDGLGVLRELRRKGLKSGVLILTARDTIDERVLGLRSGADDYMIKPFAFAELLARVEALVRRTHGVPGALIRVGSLEVDTTSRTARVLIDPPCTVDLAPREYSVLEYLAHRAGKPVARSELEEHLYDDRARIMSNAVDVAVSVLRAKLEAAGCPPIIHTRRKVGYVMSEGNP